MERITIYGIGVDDYDNTALWTEALEFFRNPKIFMGGTLILLRLWDEDEF